MQSSRPSTEQVTALLDELEANPYLAQGKLRKRSTPLWRAITKRLNLIEGCKKTCKQWMKVGIPTLNKERFSLLVVC